MGFLSVDRPAVRTLKDTFNDPAGGLAAAKWTLVDTGGGLPQTPRDVDATGVDIREPSTAVIAPNAYINSFALERTLTVRISMSVKSTSVSSGAGAFITLFRPDLAAAIRITTRVGILRAGAGPGVPDTFQHTWRGQATNVPVAGLVANTYYRIGMEIDARSGRSRGYLYTVSTAPHDETNDKFLEPYTSFAIESGANPYDDNTVFVGIGLSATGNVAGTDFSGAENLFIEEFEVPFSTSFPFGSYFEVPDYDVYQVHKASRYFRQLLTYARVE